MEAGPLTFLFTDIEGSTRRWEADPGAMSVALARHDRIVRSAIESVQGELFKHTGDGACAVFRNASEGIAAAVAVQRALEHEDWGEAAPLRVRIAIHTGPAEVRTGDYFGPTLNRAARLMATAHGGQIIVSRAAAELSRETLPAGVALLDLGEHRLADLNQPEHVFQVTHPDLRGEFPPLRSLDFFRHNLPVSLTPFVGRESELAEVEGRLGRARLLTLIGVGGVGKTRLALESAGRTLGSFPDGAFFVDLAPVRDPDLVVQAVASAVGAVVDRQAADLHELLGRLAEYLAGRRALILLDNCEHVVEPAAAVADALLRGCPRVTVLATSREPLAVPGEELWRIPSLALPPDGPARPEDVAAADAVAFLCDRAAAADPSFRLTAGNAEPVARICRRLDGIPLALELAAARFRMLTPAEAAARLDDRFRLLTRGSRTVLDRHRTLRAAVDWGYELLSPSERTVLNRLSVFAGSFDLEAAEAVVPDRAAVGRDDVLDLLGLLVDRSWVVVEAGASDRTRYRLLETIRQYAAEKLAGDRAGDATARGQHAEHFRRIATFLPDEPIRPASWMGRVDADLDNVRAAPEWFFTAGDVETCLQMTAGLSRFWGLTGRVPEGRVWLERVLAAAPPAPTVGLVGALNGMGFLLFQAGEPPAVAAAFYERARMAAQAIGDDSGYSVACGLLGFRALQRGELDESDRFMHEAIEGFQRSQRPRAVAWGEWGLGCLASARGDRAAATRHFDRVMALGRGDAESNDALTHALAALAVLKAEAGDGDGARRCAAEAIEVAGLLRIPHVEVMALVRAAEATFRLEDLPAAAGHLQQAMSMLQNMEGLSWVAYSLELSALVAARREHRVEAARLLGAARALDEVSREASEARPLHAEVDACEAELKAVLGAGSVAAELAAGAALPVKDAISLALAELGR